jgi:hypothetical protein
MDRCYHNRLRPYFDVPTRTIKKHCERCNTTFDVSEEEAKTLYIEHMGCGGLLARWLDHSDMHLKAGCTKCIYTEDREA